jgi:hypothetical protein
LFRADYPAERCNRLKIGDARAEVYFQLGQPDKATSSEARWQAEKAASEVVVATFTSERLATLSCPKFAL